MAPERDPSQLSKPSPLGRIGKAVSAVCRGLIESLPGQLLMLMVGFMAIAVVVAYFPTAANFRLQWMMDRAQSAHLAALAADVAEGGALGEEEVRQLLAGADAVAVSRVRDGMNELVLYSGPMGDDMVESDLRTAGWFTHVRDTTETLFAPSGRLLRIRAEPEGRPGEVIDVIVREWPLKQALSDFSKGLLLTSVIIAIFVGAVIYSALFFLFVRPMHRLAAAMIHFRDDPNDSRRKVVPSGERNEIGQAEVELAQMQEDIRQALHQRERLASLGSAVAKINHDLRNVLTTAQLVSDRLAMDKDSRVRGMGERLVRAVDRGVRLCEETLQFGRADEPPPVRTKVPVSALLDEAAQDAMLSEGDVDWHNQVATDLILDADPDHAHRIFLNLFRNAIQAMKSTDGLVALQASAISDGDQTLIEVRDSGPGLPDKVQARLFEAFSSSTRKGGTGLGLSIARELARAHGGDVTLISTSSDGTVFSVQLPSAT
jgi:signal transduction histidine kinase